jgi:ferredoxin
MKNKIFYFTGTGNSLAIARQMSESLGNTEIVPMAAVSGGYVGKDEERIGLVLPVFGWGMPRMAAEFVKALKPSAGQFVFAIATSGGSPGRTLVQLDKILRANGSNLDAGFVVSGDFLISVQSQTEMALIKFMSWLGRKNVPGFAKDRLPEISKIIEARKPHGPETSNASLNILGSLMYGISMKMFAKMDKDYSATNACISCGACVKLCPVENITLENGKPVWHQDCEYCFACMAFCPQSAIAMKGNVPKGSTHHPDVSLGDVLLR